MSTTYVHTYIQNKATFTFADTQDLKPVFPWEGPVSYYSSSILTRKTWCLNQVIYLFIIFFVEIPWKLSHLCKITSLLDCLLRLGGPFNIVFIAAFPLFFTKSPAGQIFPDFLIPAAQPFWRSAPCPGSSNFHNCQGEGFWAQSSLRSDRTASSGFQLMSKGHGWFSMYASTS